MQSTVDYSSNLSDMTEFFIGSFDFDKLLKLKRISAIVALLNLCAVVSVVILWKRMID